MQSERHAQGAYFQSLPTGPRYLHFTGWRGERSCRGAPSGEAALCAAHCVAQVGHSRRGDGVDDLQADLPELDAVE
jgi:hypothetical protein